MPEDAAITEEMVLRHWSLERELTRRLLASSSEERWEVFESAYSKLYSELPWLNELVGAGPVETGPFEDWGHLIGDAPKDVYEVGSGKGQLIHWLAEQGHRCKGSEVTRERGERWAVEHPNLMWGVTDGINLDRFEEPGSFDVVMSDQVIEHLHPDDLVPHLEGARALLRAGGRYVFSTPHAHYGPMDVSRVFGREKPEGMHLKEYLWSEIDLAARQAGFARVEAVLRMPRKIRRRLGGKPKPAASSFYLGYLKVIEAGISKLPRQSWRRRTARLSKLVLFEGVFAVATKEGR